MLVIISGRVNLTNNQIVTKEAVILANGQFPESDFCLDILNSGKDIICCDGSADKIAAFGLKAKVIIGDLDSISPELKKRHPEIIIDKSDQNSNDLTKAVHWAKENAYTKVIILGATGIREDHTIGNIYLLSRYNEIIAVQMVSDYGIFDVINSSSVFDSFPGQQVSVFSTDQDARFTFAGLKYEVNNRALHEAWMGTLNECTSNSFEINFDKGSAIIYRVFD
ncbi:MAG: thiamine diphosphokinase [Marinilabiliales bacterium]|nr:MAG: thiamine diphosphokinase [Marinilabiliales bacterium]